MSEKWIRWEPAENISIRYSIRSISHMIEGLYMIFEGFADENKKVYVKFKIPFNGFRSTHERYREQTWDDLSKQGYEEGFFWNKTFFKVTNSSYIEWLLKEVYDISDRSSLIHFAFIDENFLFDIVTTEEPEIIFFEEKEVCKNN